MDFGSGGMVMAGAGRGAGRRGGAGRGGKRASEFHEDRFIVALEVDVEVPGVGGGLPCDQGAAAAVVVDQG